MSIYEKIKIDKKGKIQFFSEEELKVNQKKKKESNTGFFNKLFDMVNLNSSLTLSKFGIPAKYKSKLKKIN